MKSTTYLALCLAGLFAGSAVSANEIINYTPVTAKVEDGKKVIEMPDRRTTSRRRMLVDFGLFGAGVHVGWMKSKNANVVAAQECNGDATVKQRRGIGYPILNLSAG